MRQAFHEISIATRGRGLIELELTLGTWQGIYLWEHRTHPHTRHVSLHFIGE